MIRKYPKGIRKTRDGKWQVFAKRDGKFRSKTFQTEKTIDELKREREKLIGRMVDPSAYAPDYTGRTFEQDAREYLTLVEHMPSYQDRAYRIERWIDVFGPRERKSLTAREISAVLEQWRRSGRADGKGLSPASLNQRRTALLHLFTRLDGKGGLNPVRDVPPYDERDSEIIRAVPLLVIARLIRHLRPWGQMRARLHVLMWTGWPHALLKGVQPGDVDWHAQRVRLGRRKKGKGMAAAWVPVLPRGMLSLRRFAALACWGEFSNSALHSALARALTAENKRRVKLKLPTLPPIRPYDIRHSFATWAAGIVKDDRALKELLRTNRIQRYTEGATADRLEAARSSLMAALGLRATSDTLSPRLEQAHKVAKPPKPTRRKRKKR